MSRHVPLQASSPDDELLAVLRDPWRPEHVLDWRCKGLPPGTSVRLGDVGTTGWSLVRGDLGSPVAVLRERALVHNARAMSQFAATAGLQLAPHAKTHLSPELLALQRAAGAWGFTVAVPHQVVVLREFGVDRMLIANEVADPAALRYLAALGAQGCVAPFYVDSTAGVELARTALAAHPPVAPLPVLVELGVAGGRTGARGVPAVVEVARAAAASGVLRPVGVAGYEGPIGADRAPATVAAVDAWLGELVAAHRALAGEDLLGAGIPIVSAGGSLHFDRVAAVLGPLAGEGVDVVLRSGCYLSQDHGFYDRLTPSSAWGGQALRPALEVWGRVVSRPEPSLALVNAGRRDLSHDLGLPVARWRVRDGRRVPAAGPEVTALADQHAFLALAADDDLTVGDLVGLGVSHPCTTFDSWPLLFLVDDEDAVTGAVRTFF